MAYLSCSAGRTHFARTKYKAVELNKGWPDRFEWILICQLILESFKFPSLHQVESLKWCLLSLFIYKQQFRAFHTFYSVSETSNILSDNNTVYCQTVSFDEINTFSPYFPLFCESGVVERVVPSIPGVDSLGEGFKNKKIKII